MNELLIEIEKDDEISTVIITGKGPNFSVGVDLSKSFQPDKLSSFNFEDTIERGFYKIFPSFKKIIIAAINGFCFGGALELALMCDIMIADNKA